ncbi:MAG: TRAP transporter small permease [Elusimicrobiota bacterium]|jgi:TRAP-type C4-dicarboxylate transport system permease small subunit|nr:TRAP transporter small permease [Elusimicrobiota bacterium]
MKKIYNAFCKIEELICSVTFIALVAAVFLSAILRGLGVSVSWNIDVALLLLAWTSFLGADCAFRAGQLIGIDIVTRKFEPKTQNIVEIFVLLAILFLLAFIIIYGIKLVQNDWGRQYGALPISFSWAVLSLPVASFSMSISAILKIKSRIDELKKLKKAAV